MKRKVSFLGILFILFGIIIIFKNFNIMPGRLVTVIIGIFFLCLSSARKQNSFLLIGLILVASGTLYILRDLNIFSFDRMGEILLVFIGLVFAISYFSNKSIGFLTSGVILISLGLYLFLINHYDDTRLWPCFFILLGMAFYSIYFIALYGEGDWPLVIGTMLNLTGILLLGFNYGVLNWKLLKYFRYIWPSALVAFGLILIFKRIRKRRG
ncbi:MAG: hypothetical protein M0P77_06330 [Firmicutes bacterium]|nr:hypothetical protein [Bacillota bacterium]